MLAVLYMYYYNNLVFVVTLVARGSDFRDVAQTRGFQDLSRGA